MLDVPKLHRDAEISNVSHKSYVTNLMSNPKKCNFKSFNPFSDLVSCQYRKFILNLEAVQSCKNWVGKTSKFSNELYNIQNEQISNIPVLKFSENLGG